jgi:hypothetical protein
MKVDLEIETVDRALNLSAGVVTFASTSLMQHGNRRMRSGQIRSPDGDGLPSGRAA